MIENLQIGVDIATALSVIGASTAFIFRLNHEAKQSRIRERATVNRQLFQTVKQEILSLVDGHSKFASQKKTTISGEDMNALTSSFEKFISRAEHFLIPYCEGIGAEKLNQIIKEHCADLSRLNGTMYSAFVESKDAVALAKATDELRETTKTMITKMAQLEANPLST